MATELQQAGSAGGALTELDEFSAILKQNFKPRSDVAAREVENAVGTLVREALADESVITDDILDTIDKMLAKMLKLRIFSDEVGKMNRSVQDVAGGLLVVSQFTLAADVAGGNRPSFTQAAAPEDGRRLYEHFVAQARAAHPVVQTGRFAADMKVSLVNDGPITIPMRMTA